MRDLFETLEEPRPPAMIAEGAMLLPGFALAFEDALLAALDAIVAAAPFRHMTTPGGYVMSVATTSCGEVGWITDRRGYRYEPFDPLSGKPWPAMPEVFASLAECAAERAGFTGFAPDSCLVNRYDPGAKMATHQDKDERDVTAPIVSVSLGLPATFLFGGPVRSDKTQRIPLHHGDVMVWGGPSRLFFHGIAPLREGEHPRLGPNRINLTFRKAR